jgi:hypothetical protein
MRLRLHQIAFAGLCVKSPVTDKYTGFLRVSSHELMRRPGPRMQDDTPRMSVGLRASDAMVEPNSLTRSDRGATEQRQPGFEFHHGNQS